MGQKKPKKKLNRFFIICIISLFFIIIILGLYYIPSKINMIRNIELTAVKWRFESKAVSKAETVAGTLKLQSVPGIYKKIIFAAIDDSTINRFGSLTIDRKVWADILKHFDSQPEESQPRAVFFDLFFNEPSPDPESDSAFIDALKHFKGYAGESIRLDEVKDKRLNNKEILNYDSPSVRALKRFELNIKNNLNVQTFPKIIAPIPEIAQSLGFIGTINMDFDGDVYRKNPLILGKNYYVKNEEKESLTNVYYPSSALVIAARLLKSNISNIVIEKNTIIIRDAEYNGKRIDFKIPVDNQYRLSVNYRAEADAGFLKTISVKDLERAGLPRDSIILIGVNVHGFTENEWLSPLESMKSTQHLAYSIGTIMNRDFIIELPLWVNLIYILLLTAIIGALISKNIRFTIPAFLISIIVPFGLGFGLFQLNIEILTLLPVIICILVIIAGEIYLILTEQREKRFIKNTFSKYINPELVNILIQNPDMIETRRARKRCYNSIFRHQGIYKHFGKYERR